MNGSQGRRVQVVKLKPEVWSWNRGVKILESKSENYKCCHIMQGLSTCSLGITNGSQSFIKGPQLDYLFRLNC